MDQFAWVRGLRPQTAYGVTLGDLLPPDRLAYLPTLVGSDGISPPGSTGVLNPSCEGRGAYG